MYPAKFFANHLKNYLKPYCIVECRYDRYLSSFFKCYLQLGRYLCLFALSF